MFLLLAACGTAACELVLGELPAAKQHGSDAGTGGAQASSSSGSSSGSTSSGSSSSASSSSSAASSGAGGCCDCDGDKDPAKGACAGKDCDDHDSNAYFGEPYYSATASANPNVDFDWDCNGTTEQDPTLKIAIDCPPVGLPCPGGTGFLAKVPPACGMTADWGTCNQSGAACLKAVVEANKAMKCK